MLFNSLHFFAFFIIVTAIYYLLPYKLRWILLLAASCYFYMAFVPVYILILGFTIVVDYIAGLCIENAQQKKRKLFLICSLFANIGVLAVFKYYNFANENLSSLLHYFGVNNPVPFLSILLPIGLSFHTFQAMSYTIEVYRGNQKAERHFGIYALYVMFYPQLVAGPIERPQNLLHQFREKHLLQYNNFAEGLKLMIWGLFKKIVIADRLSIYVNTVYNNADQHNGTTLIVATLFFSVQIYCDFSGYSDIAIGAARVMGFKLMSNFKRPYFSKSISEFWQRWHISLSTWFKDYLYFPLGGNKVSIKRWCFNILVVFIISGFWHGANWTFILWGAINGFYLLFARFTQNIRTKLTSLTGLSRLPKINLFIQVVITWLLTCFAWIFFRANSTKDAFEIVKKIFSTGGAVFTEGSSVMVFSCAGVLFLFLVEFKRHYYNGLFSLSNNTNRLIPKFYYCLLVIMILLVGVADGGQFIYFQF